MANLLGTTVSGNIYVSGYSDVNPTNGSFRFYDGSTFRGGFGLNSWAFGGGSSNDLNLYVANDSTLYISTNGVNRHYFNSGEAAFKTYSPDLNYKISILGGDQLNAYYGSGAATLYLQYHGNAGGDIRIAGNKFRFDNGNSKLIFQKSTGTIISHGSMEDAIGYNGEQGTYIGSAVGGTYYLYGNGKFYDAGTMQTLIHTGNIGSQSVNYATSAGTASNSDSLGGIGAAGYLRDDGWNNYPGQDANTQGTMRSDFTYSNNAPWTGELVRFGASGYSIQLNGQYGGDGGGLSFRNRNGDNGTWNSWYQFIHSGNIGGQSVSYASSAGNADTVDGLHASSLHVVTTDPGTPGNGVISIGNNGSYSYVQSHAGQSLYLNPVGNSIYLNSTTYLSGNEIYSVGNIYNNGWYRNYGYTGIYNQSYGTHFYSSTGAAWNITGSGGTIELRFRSNHESTIRGYVYADTSNQIGFLNNGGGWALRTNSSNNAFVHGAELTINADSASYSNIIMNDGDEGNRIIHCNSNRIGFLDQSGSWGSWCDDNGAWNSVGNISGNYLYSNYSVRVGEIWGFGGLYRSSGAMLFGTENAGWSFRSSNSEKVYIATDGNIYMAWAGDYISNLLGAKQDKSTAITTSNIGSQSVNYANSSSQSNVLAITGYGNGNMSYYQTSGTFAGYSGWAGYFVSNHGDGATYYNQTIIMPFWGPPQYSRLQGGTFVGPYTFWTTENLNNYAPNMNQYVRTSDDVMFASTTTQTFLVANHSDNTKGYRIHNTSGSSVSAMFTNSSNFLVIGAGAFNQINLNKQVYINGVGLGVGSISPAPISGRIDASNDIVAYSSSDERLKENITPIENALDKVKSLTGVEFDWKPEHKDAHGHEGHDTGIIAQQVQEIMPTAVRTNDTGFLAVRYEKLIGLLVEGMKEQQAQIEELKAKLDGLTK